MATAARSNLLVMADVDRRRRSRSGRLLDSLIWGVALGAVSGAVLGDAIDGVGASIGSLIGVTLYAPAEAITSLTKGPAEPKPLWHRIISSALLMALFGWLLGVLFDPDGPLLTAVLSGALLGLLGLRPLKAAIGLMVGAVLGVLFQLGDVGLDAALVAALVTVAYRLVAAVAYRNRPLVRVMAEEVPASELRYVVPFEARSRYVGADYVERLAKVHGGTFARNPPDVGILASLDNLDGPTFDAGRVHPLIREFYEHTSRFRLSIIPEWRPWMKPAYEVFKRLVAEPLGQAAIPSNIEEAQRGMVSTIDTITLDGHEDIDIRGWIRTFADSEKPIYVGIYKPTSDRRSRWSKRSQARASKAGSAPSTQWGQSPRTGFPMVLLLDARGSDARRWGERLRGGGAACCHLGVRFEFCMA